VPNTKRALKFFPAAGIVYLNRKKPGQKMKWFSQTKAINDAGMAIGPAKWNVPKCSQLTAMRTLNLILLMDAL
jgi:hypothetical protein